MKKTISTIIFSSILFMLQSNSLWADSCSCNEHTSGCSVVTKNDGTSECDCDVGGGAKVSCSIQ